MFKLFQTMSKRKPNLVVNPKLTKFVNPKLKVESSTAGDSKVNHLINTKHFMFKIVNFWCRL